MMTCKEIRGQLSPYMDGELADPLDRMVAEHLAKCSACAAVLERLQQDWALLAEYPASEISSGFTDRLMRRIAETSDPPMRATIIPFDRRSRALAVLAAILLFAVLLTRPHPGRSGAANESLPVSDRIVIENIEVFENIELLRDLEMLSEMNQIEDAEGPIS